MSGHASRATSRQLALQILYAADLAAIRHPDEPRDPAAAFESVAANFDLPEAARAFAKQLVFGVTERLEELDALLSEHARNWRVDRMAAVDRNVLRIAVYELLDTDTPSTVVIDQAIELARRFGDDPSPAFVNGVIDAVAVSVERPESSVGGEA